MSPMDPAIQKAVLSVQNAMIAKKKNNSMLLDQRGFIDACHSALAMVPQDRKEAAGNCMAQAINMFYNSSHPQCGSFRNWIDKHGLFELFFVNEMTQDDRYSAIVERLTEAENRNLDQERDFVDMAKVFRVRMRQSAASDFCEKYKGSLARIVKTKHDIMEKRKADREMEAFDRAEQLRRFTQGFKQNISIPSWNVDIREDLSKEPIEVKVKTGLDDMSYYCGYRPGAYIFRFENTESSDSDFDDLIQWDIADPVQQKPANLEEEPATSFRQRLSDARNGQRNDVRFDSGPRRLYASVLKGTPARDPINFTYCGIVPRNLKEHIARLRDIHSRVLHIIVATLTFVETPATASNSESVLAMGDRMKNITGEDLFTIAWYWAFHFPVEKPFPEQIRDVFYKVPVISEFVDLMVMMDAEVAPQVLSLLAMVLQATGWTMEEMVVLEAMRQAETGLNLLLNNYKENGNAFFVFQDDSIGDDNILEMHDHFAQECFTLDPNHPRLQYQTTADFAAKITKEYEFVHCLEKHWLEEFLPEFLAQGAASKTQSSKRLPSSDADIEHQQTISSALLSQSQPKPKSQAESKGQVKPKGHAEPSQSGKQSVEVPAKRGRGRPPGAKNKKTIAEEIRKRNAAENCGILEAEDKEPSEPTNKKQKTQ